MFMQGRKKKSQTVNNLFTWQHLKVHRSAQSINRTVINKHGVAIIKHTRIHV